MNYRKHYDLIIDRARQRVLTGYVEKHHVVPRSLGGTNDIQNIVSLTAREHFICHFLLVKMYTPETVEWYKMINAFRMMNVTSTNHSRYSNSRLYEYLRKNFSATMRVAQSGKNNSQYGTMWICNITLQENKKISTTTVIPNGWIRGRNKWVTPKPRKYTRTTPYVDRIELSKRMSESAKIRAKRNPSSVGKNSIWINDQQSLTRRIPKDEPIPQHWVRGRLMPK